MKIIAIVLIMLAATSAQAQSALIGKRLISRGDDVSRLRSIGIRPVKLDQIDADEHSPAMEVWTYVQGARSIAVWLVNGKVVQVQEQAAE
jgi:hypothetical protein